MCDFSIGAFGIQNKGSQRSVFQSACVEILSPVSIVVGLLLVAGSAVAPAQAETMRSALTSAYKNNPQLDAARATLRATDEGVQQARSGWAPTVNGEATIEALGTRTEPGSVRSSTRSSELNLQITQPVFTGFRTLNAVSQAEANVRAGRAQLRNVESLLLLNVAEAYLDVVRDRELVRLTQRLVSIFNRDLVSARSRLRVGEVTRTDVNQTGSRRAQGIADLEEAKGNLRQSEATYQQFVGRSPLRLRTKGLVLGRLPKTLGAAIGRTRRENALVEQALYLEQAARFAVSTARSELLPRFDIEAELSRTFSSDTATSREDSAEVVGRLQVPIYQAGLVRSQIRQFKHLHVSQLQAVEQVRRTAVNDVRAGWALYKSAKRRLKSNRSRIKFVRTALKGVRNEERVGQRTVLEVLDAETEVFEAMIALVNDQRDRDLGHYQVLRAMGQLDAEFLSLAKVQYDPVAHYTDAKSKWFTTRITKKSRNTWQTRRTHAPTKLGGPQGWRATAVKARPVPIRTSRGARVTTAADGWHTRTQAAGAVGG